MIYVVNQFPRTQTPLNFSRPPTPLPFSFSHSSSLAQHNSFSHSSSLSHNSLSQARRKSFIFYAQPKHALVVGTITTRSSPSGSIWAWLWRGCSLAPAGTSSSIFGRTEPTPERSNWDYLRGKSIFLFLFFFFNMDFVTVLDLGSEKYMWCLLGDGFWVWCSFNCEIQFAGDVDE
jgi:hypothetical protein